jgi:sterol desaturase/sphingolipid hydroxylase (fatty acid hydroxylase superfamily)
MKIISDQMPSSLASADTSSESEGFKELIENEEARYKRKGYGLVFATLITLTCFFLAPDFLYNYYKTLPHENVIYMSLLIPEILHLLVIITSNTCLYIIYKLSNPFFERYKILDAPWPWESDPSGFKAQLKATLKTIIFNNFILLPLAFYLPVYFGTVEMQTDVMKFPSSLELISQITFCMIVEDTVFYWTHRLMHTSYLYKNIHKKHHEYKHTIGIAAEYAHPVEFVLSNMVPTGAGLVLLGKRCHVFTWYMWLVIRVLETTDAHCGYEFSWSPFRLLPFSGSSSYHNFHHSKNIGNYSSFFTYWDTLCQTNKHYWKSLSKAEKSM